MARIVRRTLLLMASVALLACREKTGQGPRFPEVQVRRGDLVVKASADGVIEPVRTIEVKSKASGEIVQMPVDSGQTVRAGQILVQLLPKDAQSSFDQASAELEAAAARLAQARVGLERAQRLSTEGLLPAESLESAALAVQNARSDEIRAKKSLDQMAERLAETTVRAPIDGTVIGRHVEVGQVVSSAVSQVSGGTLLLTLADLDEIQVRSLVDEVDIGRIRIGADVEIRVEAHADRRFRGRVAKIEPQAVVEQNVTMFPVLTRIENREGLLLPGMNAEVEIAVASRQNVLLVPIDVIKPAAEATRLQAMLGIGGSGAEGSDDKAPRKGGRNQGRAGSEATDRPAGNAERGGFVAFRKGVGDALEPVPVEVGLKSWDDAEILSGLAENDRVVVLPSAGQLRQAAEFRDRMQRMRGMPGMSGGSPRRSGS